MKIKNFVLLSALGVSLFNPFSISKVSAATSTKLTLSIPKQITLGQNSQGGFKGNFKVETKEQVIKSYRYKCGK